MRLRDSPVPPAQTRSWAVFLQPAGFREALGLALFAPDGVTLADTAWGALGSAAGTVKQPARLAHGVGFHGSPLPAPS